jgi:hypothetical protein
VLDAPVSIERKRRDRQPAGGHRLADKSRSRKEHQQRKGEKDKKKFAAGEQQTRVRASSYWVATMGLTLSRKI